MCDSAVILKFFNIYSELFNFRPPFSVNYDTSSKSNIAQRAAFLFITFVWLWLLRRAFIFFDSFAFYAALFAATIAIAIAIAIISANSDADRRPKTKAKRTHFHAKKGSQGDK